MNSLERDFSNFVGSRNLTPGPEYREASTEVGRMYDALIGKLPSSLQNDFAEYDEKNANLAGILLDDCYRQGFEDGLKIFFGSKSKTEKRTFITDYPLVLVPEDVAQILGISMPKVYELCRRRDFPKLMNGVHILIPRQAFWLWLNTIAVGLKIEDYGESGVDSPLEALDMTDYPEPERL